MWPFWWGEEVREVSCGCQMGVWWPGKWGLKEIQVQGKSVAHSSIGHPLWVGHRHHWYQRDEDAYYSSSWQALSVSFTVSEKWALGRWVPSLARSYPVSCTATVLNQVSLPPKSMLTVLHPAEQRRSCGNPWRCGRLWHQPYKSTMKSRRKREIKIYLKNNSLGLLRTDVVLKDFSCII